MMNDAPSGQEPSNVSSSGPTVNCRCGAPATKHKSSKQNENFGKFYYTCGLKSSDPTKCTYWKWEDEALASLNDPRGPKTREYMRYEKVYCGERKRLDLDALACPVVQHTSPGQRIEPMPVLDTNAKKRSPEIHRKDILVEVIAQMAERNGSQVRLADSYLEIYYHRDLHIVKGPYHEEMDAWVLVRPAQKINPSDTQVQYDKCWLQLHGITPNDQGWIIRGDSNFIAFEEKDCITFVNRKALWKYIDTRIPKDEYVTEPSLALGKKIRMDGFSGSWHEVKSLVSLETLREYNATITKEEKLIGDCWPIPLDLKEKMEKCLS